MAISLMRRALDEPLTVDDLAREAALSRCHFSRLFSGATGLSPTRFLTALRVRAAQHLLVTTSWSVTEITHRVGYDGIGTFSWRFTAAAGVTPSTYRAGLRLPPRSTGRPGPDNATSTPHHVEGRIVGSEVPVVVGLFDRPAMHGRPAAWTIVEAGDRYRLDRPPTTTCHVLARALDVEDDVAWRALGSPVAPQDGAVVARDLELRPPRITDPPALSALPYRDRTGPGT